MAVEQSTVTLRRFDGEKDFDFDEREFTVV